MANLTVQNVYFNGSEMVNIIPSYTRTLQNATPDIPSAEYPSSIQNDILIYLFSTFNNGSHVCLLNTGSDYSPNFPFPNLSADIVTQINFYEVHAGNCKPCGPQVTLPIRSVFLEGMNETNLSETNPALYSSNEFIVSLSPAVPVTENLVTGSDGNQYTLNVGNSLDVPGDHTATSLTCEDNLITHGQFAYAIPSAFSPFTITVKLTLPDGSVFDKFFNVNTGLDIITLHPGVLTIPANESMSVIAFYKTISKIPFKDHFGKEHFGKEFFGKEIFKDIAKEGVIDKLHTEGHLLFNAIGKHPKDTDKFIKEHDKFGHKDGFKEKEANGKEGILEHGTPGGLGAGLGVIDAITARLESMEQKITELGKAFIPAENRPEVGAQITTEANKRQ